jgi:hypothetical protein
MKFIAGHWLVGHGSVVAHSSGIQHLHFPLRSSPQSFSISPHQCTAGGRQLGLGLLGKLPFLKGPGSHGVWDSVIIIIIIRPYPRKLPPC